MSRTWTLPELRRLHARLRAGEALVALATELGVTSNALRAAFRHQGLPGPSALGFDRRRGRRVSAERLEALRRLHARMAAGEPVAALAAEIGWASRYLCTEWRRHGLPGPVTLGQCRPPVQVTSPERVALYERAHALRREGLAWAQVEARCAAEGLVWDGSTSLCSAAGHYRRSRGTGAPVGHTQASRRARVLRPLEVDPAAPPHRCRILGCGRPPTRRGLCDACRRRAARRRCVEAVALPPWHRRAA